MLDGGQYLQPTTKFLKLLGALKVTDRDKCLVSCLVVEKPIFIYLVRTEGDLKGKENGMLERGRNKSKINMKNKACNLKRAIFPNCQPSLLTLLKLVGEKSLSSKL